MALFKRKDKENKKGSENAIGKIIYGFLLFMPLLSIGARCLYVIFNKNAYQSYSDSSVRNLALVNTTNLQVDHEHYMIAYNPSYTLNNVSTPVYFYNCTADFTQFGNINFDVYGYRIQSGGNYIYLYDENSTQHNITTNRDTIISVLNGQSFEYRTGNMYSPSNQWYFDYYLITYKTDTIDNVFEYSINQTQESNIYNWAKQTGTYTVLHNTTTGLGITNEFIPMLMAYWLIVSVIYFIFDIALILIWLVHNKIHELQESV